MNNLDAAYRECARLARRAGSNFYFAFFLLPREKRWAMYPLYAYLRRVDDLGDDETRDISARREALVNLRRSLAAALAGETSDAVLTALADTVTRYHIPAEHLTAVIDGVEMDLAGTRYETFADLEQYCQRVASAVGLACIHIWGYRGPRALEPARRCGIAFQLTNILRDLRDDLRHGRIYLPGEDLRRFHYSAEELEHGEADERFTALMQFEINRAHGFFEAAAELEPLLERDGRRVMRAMTGAYRRLLEKIERSPAQVLRRRVRLKPWEKLWIAARTSISPRTEENNSQLETAPR